jgi:hypothetical protein
MLMSRSHFRHLPVSGDAGSLHPDTQRCPTATE